MNNNQPKQTKTADPAYFVVLLGSAPEKAMCYRYSTLKEAECAGNNAIEFGPHAVYANLDRMEKYRVVVFTYCAAE